MNICKTTISLLVFTGSWSFSHTATVSSATKPAAIDPPAKAWHHLKLIGIVQLSPRTFSYLTGKKMNLTERIAFRLLKMKMKKALKKNPDMMAGEFFAAQKKMKNWLLIILIVLCALLLVLIIGAIVFSTAFI